MRYKYCPNCDQLSPRRVLTGDRCESCRGETVIIRVPRSPFGWAMITADIIAVILLVLYIAHNDFNAQFASFLDGVDNTVIMVLIFGLILGSFVLSFLDLGRTNQQARCIVDERKGRHHV
jgi:uncharacterized integral membrane protein